LEVVGKGTGTAKVKLLNEFNGPTLEFTEEEEMAVEVVEIAEGAAVAESVGYKGMIVLELPLLAPLLPLPLPL